MSDREAYYHSSTVGRKGNGSAIERFSAIDNKQPFAIFPHDLHATAVVNQAGYS